jgi:hypothetical protein
MRYFTLDEVMALKPCYSEEKLLTYMEGRKRISLIDILNSKADDLDKIWLVVRLMPIDKTIEFAQWCADDVKHLDNPYSRWASSKASYAADAAVAAVAYAAADAARAAAGATIARAAADASRSAAGAAAYTAADAAAVSIYSTAATATVYTKARKNQVSKLKEIVRC